LIAAITNRFGIISDILTSVCRTPHVYIASTRSPCSPKHSAALYMKQSAGLERMAHIVFITTAKPMFLSQSLYRVGLQVQALGILPLIFAPESGEFNEDLPRLN
jgi:hypothetical protein